MKLKMKRFFSIFMAFMCLVAFMPEQTMADTDVESSLYGFEVDLSKYYTPIWYDVVTTKVYLDGNLIGVCTTNVGFTRAKKKASNGSYIDQVLIKCTMKGRGARSYYGYSEHLTIASSLPVGMELMSYSPESEAGESSYTVGAEASTDKTVGISAETTITKKALTINCYSDTDARIVKECYDYKNDWVWPSQYKIYGKYAYNESIQRCHYAYKTSKTGYTTRIKVTSKFERKDSTPGPFTYSYGDYSSVEMTIDYITPSVYK